MIVASGLVSWNPTVHACMAAACEVAPEPTSVPLTGFSGPVVTADSVVSDPPVVSGPAVVSEPAVVADPAVVGVAAAVVAVAAAVVLLLLLRGRTREGRGRRTERGVLGAWRRRWREEWCGQSGPI